MFYNTFEIGKHVVIHILFWIILQKNPLMHLILLVGVQIRNTHYKQWLVNVPLIGMKLTLDWWIRPFSLNMSFNVISNKTFLILPIIRKRRSSFFSLKSARVRKH